MDYAPGPAVGVSQAKGATSSRGSGSTQRPPAQTSKRTTTSQKPTSSKVSPSSTRHRTTATTGGSKATSSSTGVSSRKSSAAPQAQRTRSTQPAKDPARTQRGQHTHGKKRTHQTEEANGVRDAQKTHEVSHSRQADGTRRAQEEQKIDRTRRAQAAQDEQKIDRTRRAQEAQDEQDIARARRAQEAQRADQSHSDERTRETERVRAAQQFDLSRSMNRSPAPALALDRKGAGANAWHKGTELPVGEQELGGLDADERKAFGEAFAGMPRAHQQNVKLGMGGLTPDQRTQAAELIGRQHLDRQHVDPAAQASSGAGRAMLKQVDKAAPIDASTLQRKEADGSTTLQHATGQSFNVSADGHTVHGAGFSMRRENGDRWRVTTGAEDSRKTSEWRGDVHRGDDGSLTFKNADGSRTRYAANGDKITTDRDGRVTDKISVERRADGSETWKNQNGQPTFSRDANGRTRAHQYDAAGNLSGMEVSSPDGATVLFEKSGDGYDVQRSGSDEAEHRRGVLSLDRDGNARFLAQSDAGERVGVTTWRQDGSTVQQGRDGRVTSVTNATGQTTSVGEDSGVRALSDGTLVRTSTNEAGHEIDAFALTSGATVEHNTTQDTAALLGADGTLRAVANAKGQAFGFRYDAQGELNAMVDPGGSVWQRGEKTDHGHTWRNQAGKSFNGAIEPGKERTQMTMVDGLTGHRTEVSAHHVDGTTTERTFDRNDEALRIKHRNEGVSVRARDDDGKLTSRWNETWPKGLDGRSEPTKTVFDGDRGKRISLDEDRKFPEPGQGKKDFDSVRLAKDIKEAVSPGFTGLGTDEAKIFDTLNGLTRDQRNQLRAEYRSQTKGYWYPNGRDMDKDVLGDLSNYDPINGYTGWYDRAHALLHGQQAKADAIGLYNATRGGYTGLGTKERQVMEILDRQSSGDQRQRLEDQYRRFARDETLRDRLKADLGGAEYDRAVALLDGNRARARAAEVREAMKGGLTGLGVDSQTVYDALRTDKNGRPLTSGQRGAIADEYERLYGHGRRAPRDIMDSKLAEDIQGEFWRGPHQDQAVGLLKGDQAAANAAKAKQAMHGDGWGITFWDGWGTDERSLNDAVRGNIGDVQKAYDAKYGEGAFNRDRASELNKQDYDTNQEIGERREASAARRMWNAMYGMGTDEDKLIGALGGRDGRGLTAKELDEARREYAEITKAQTGRARHLDRDVDAELSGRPDFDAKQLLKGRPEDIHQEVDRFNENYAWERKGIGNAVANGFNWLANDKGGQLDHAARSVRDQYDAAMRDGRVTPQEARAIRREMATGRANQDSYRNTRDAATDAVGTVATTAATIGVTLISGGTATPAVVAWAAAAGAGTNLSTRWAMQGAGYQAGDGVRDFALGGLEGATIGLGPGKWAKSPFMTKLGQTAGGRVLARTAVGMSEGFKGGAIMGGGMSALNENTWKDGLGQGLAQVGQDSLVGGGLGAVTGGALANALPPVVASLQKRFGKAKTPAATLGPDGVGAKAASDRVTGDRILSEPLSEARGRVPTATEAKVERKALETMTRDQLRDVGIDAHRLADAGLDLDVKVLDSGQAPSMTYNAQTGRVEVSIPRRSGGRVRVADVAHEADHVRALVDAKASGDTRRMAELVQASEAAQALRRAQAEARMQPQDVDVQNRLQVAQHRYETARAELTADAAAKRAAQQRLQALQSQQQGDRRRALQNPIDQNQRALDTIERRLARTPRAEQELPFDTDLALRSLERPGTDPLKPITAQTIAGDNNQVLILGDGDFSFTSAFVDQVGGGDRLVATSYDALDDIVRKYPGQQSDGIRPASANIDGVQSAGATVRHGVDATALADTLNVDGPFDSVVFNYPHVPEASRGGTANTKAMLDNFFGNAGQVMADDGRIYVTLANERALSRLKPVQLAQDNGWKLLDTMDFDPTAFPGYRHQRTVRAGSASSVEGNNGITLVFGR